MDVIHHSDDLCGVVWRIDSVGSKLRTSRGFPLLSPVFALAGLPDLRLMFAPGDEWLELPGAAVSRKQKSQKQRLTKQAISDSSAFGAVKVKAGDLGSGAKLCFHFEVFFGASCYAGAPGLQCDFSTEVVQSCPLEADWRTHIEGGCLVLRFEFSRMAFQQ